MSSLLYAIPQCRSVATPGKGRCPAELDLMHGRPHGRSSGPCAYDDKGTDHGVKFFRLDVDGPPTERLGACRSSPLGRSCSTADACGRAINCSILSAGLVVTGKGERCVLLGARRMRPWRNNAGPVNQAPWRCRIPRVWAHRPSSREMTFTPLFNCRIPSAIFQAPLISPLNQLRSR